VVFLRALSVSSFNYSPITATALKLITSFGKNVTIVNLSGGTFDPVLGVDAGQTTNSQTVKAVSLPASGGKIAALDARFKLGGEVFEKYAFIIISGSDANFTFEPQPGDKVTLDGLEWYVIGVTPTRPNTGNAIVYELALRI